MDFVKIYQKAWRPIYIIPVLAAIVIAFLDAQAFQMFQQLANPGQVYTAIENDYLDLFHNLLRLGVLSSTLIVYYYRDFRDALSYLTMAFTAIYSGLWDILYYQFPFTPGMPATLPHLEGSPMSLTSVLLNGGTVTPSMLILNVLVFFLVGLPLAGAIRYNNRLDFLDQAPDW